MYRIGGSGLDIRSKARVIGSIYMILKHVSIFGSVFYFFLVLVRTLTRLMMGSSYQSVKAPIKSPKDLPNWNYDGSSTGQAPGQDSEVIL